MPQLGNPAVHNNLDPPVTMAETQFSQSQIDRVLDSANHAERVQMLDECKRKFDKARDEFLASKGITEEELLKIGYRKKTWTPSALYPHWHDMYERYPGDRYEVYQSLTGRPIKTFIFTSDQFEEERMMDIGNNMAFTFGVHPHQVALTKELCGKSGKCRISVTLCSTGDGEESSDIIDYGEESEEYDTDSDEEEY